MVDCDAYDGYYSIGYGYGYESVLDENISFNSEEGIICDDIVVYDSAIESVEVEDDPDSDSDSVFMYYKPISAISPYLNSNNISLIDPKHLLLQFLDLLFNYNCYLIYHHLIRFFNCYFYFKF